MAKGIYVGVDGIARKVKKAYIGADGNLVANGDFSDGLNGWESPSSNLNVIVQDECAKVQLVSLGTQVGYTYISTPINTVEGHIYYITSLVKGQVGNADLKGRIALVGAKTHTGNSIDCSSEVWQKSSNYISTVSGGVYEVRCQLLCKNSDNTITTGMTLYFDDVRAYDLTAMFGAGNEPTQEWCDANLEALAKKSVARKVKKSYIGVGGVARLFYSTEKVLSYYGTAENLTNYTYSLAATTVGDYALFGGGQNYKGVDTYTSKLVKGTATSFARGRANLAATSVGDYAIFAGGDYSSTWYNDADTYTSSLTKGTATNLSKARGSLAATSVGGYAIFAGGSASGSVSSTVDTYTSALVKGSNTLSVARSGLAATTVGDYALFGGGGASDYINTVDGFNTSAVKVTVTALSVKRSNLTATTVGDYALFGGGKTSSHRATVDTYTSSLVKGTATDLSEARSYFAATSVGGYALFAGGTNSATVDTYTSSLVKDVATNLSVARAYLAATTVGDCALFGGGILSSNGKKTVDVYQLVGS